MAGAVAMSNPYEYTATGVLGEKRDTMLQNQLLLRCELGRPMRRGYASFPDGSVRYGRPNAQADGGASEAMGTWNSNLPFPSKKGVSSDQPKTERDFMSLNRAAVQAGLTSAPEHYQFRATHDVRRNVKSEEGRSKLPRRLPPSMVFGISTRPSTPIHDLLEHRYQDLWLSDRRTNEVSRRRQDDRKLNNPGPEPVQGRVQRRLPPINSLLQTPGKVYNTRATLLRTHQVPVEAPPLWQMSRFTRTAKPHLETFRGEQAKEAAFEHHKSDCISRRGVFGHGIYEQAKS